MALRDLATGADGCAPDGGASGSGTNAAAALADALLGRPTKAHEGAHEVRERKRERKERLEVGREKSTHRSKRVPPSFP